MNPRKNIRVEIMKRIFFFVMLLVSVTVGQRYDNYIKGRITERQTGKPLPGVNVYLNDTLFGTTTDDMGYFKIGSIFPGNYDLVASMIGYELYSKPLRIKSDSKISEKIFLEEHVYEFNDVEVTDKESIDWQDNYKKFSKVFFGSTVFADDCDIINKYGIDFDKRGESLIAKAREPLTIENKALGYEIICDLIFFDYNEANGSKSFIVNTFFKEMNSGDDSAIGNYLENRDKAYFGSLQHFLESLVKNDVKEEGYQIRLVTMPVADPRDPPGYRTVSTESILKPDKYGMYKILKFDYYLQVYYHNPVNFNDELSYLSLKFEEVNLDQFGIPIEVIPFVTYGIWAKDGMANMLPKYFKPNKSNNL